MNKLNLLDLAAMHNIKKNYLLTRIIKNIPLFIYVLLGLSSISTANAAIAVSKSITAGFPGIVNPGDPTRFTITLINDNTGSAVNNVAFNDAMAAAGIEIAPSGLISNTCSGTVTATVGSNNIVLANGVIPIATGVGTPGKCDIVVEVASTTPGPATNTIPTGGVAGNDGAAVNNSSPTSQSFSVLPLNPPVVGKSFAPSAVVQSDPASVSVLTITINNPNAGADLPLTTVTDNLPAGIQVAPTPGASISCTGTGAVNGTFAPAANATTLTVTGGKVGQNGTCTMKVNVVGTASGPTGSQTLTNTITPAQVVNTRGLTANTATAGITVNSPIRAGKAFTPNPIGAGQQATLTIYIYNDSSLPYSVTTFQDSPIGTPAGLLITGAVSTTCAGGAVSVIDGNTGVQLIGGAIPPGGNCTITVLYTATLPVPGTPQTFADNIPAGAVLNSGGFVSQAGSGTVLVNDQLVATKSVSPSNPAPGQPITYTIQVDNFTGAARNNTTFTDNLQSGVIALASPAPSISGAGCTLVSNTVANGIVAPNFVFNMPAGAVPNPSTCFITFTAEIPAGSLPGANINNSIPAGAVCSGGICNSGPTTIATNTIDTTLIAKSFNPNTLSEGGISQLTISLVNNSAAPLNITSLTDYFTIDGTVSGAPLGIQVASPANVGSTCGAPTLTAIAGSNSVRIQNGVVPARATNGSGAAGTCTLTVNVTGPAGNYTNIIPANALQATTVVARVPNQPVTYPNTVTGNLSFNPALTAAKSFSPSNVSPGGKTQLRIRLGNVGNTSLNNVSFNDPLPLGDMAVATPPNASTTCPGAPVVTAVAGSSSVVLSGAQLIPGLTCDVLIDVVSSSAATSTNTIPIGNVTAAGGVKNTAVVSASLTKTPGSIVISKSISPNTITAPGASSTLTVTLLNNGALPLTNVSFTDFFRVGGTAGGALSGLQVETNPNIVTNCPGAVVSALSDGNRIDVTGISLAAAGTCTISVDVTSLRLGTVQNTIPVGAITSTEGVSNSGLTVSSLAILAQISAVKSFTPRTTVPGQRSRMRFTFINPLSVSVSNLGLADNLPGGMIIPAGANPQTTCVGATLTTPTNAQFIVSGGTMPRASGGVSTTCYAEIDVVAGAVGSYNNTVPPGGLTATAGGTPVTNTDPITDTLKVLLPVTLNKAFSVSPVKIGQPSTLTITITNPNNVALNGGSLTDNLPAGLVVGLTPNASTTCVGGPVVSLTAVASSNSIGITGAKIPANGSCSISVDTLSNSEGSYVNIIPANAFNSSEGVKNAEPTTATLIVAAPPTIAKQFSPVSIASGGVSTLTISLGNPNAAAISLTADLVDTLPTAPSNIVIAGVPNVIKTCPGSVIANAGNGTVTYQNGGSIPAGGCTISVDVTGTVNGTYTNFIAPGALQTNVGNNILGTTADLNISPLGFISGRVFKDNNVTPNGTFQAGTDTPIPSVSVSLTGTDFGPDGVAGGGDDVAVNLTTTTDALGNYSFAGLRAGNYTVTEPTQPAGTNNGITTAGAIVGAAGGTAGSATAIAVTPSAVSNIILNRTAGGAVSNSAGNNFAEVVPSSISGVIFKDVNNNGVQNGADTPLAGVRVDLLDSLGALITFTTTLADGSYSFPNLAPGTYSAREPSQPTGTSNGLTVPGAVANGGTAGTATAVTTTPSRINTIVLPPNTNSTANNFAEIPNDRSLSGSVFIDYNNDGQVNGADNGLGGQTINLTGTDINGNAVSLSTVTLADGTYSFPALPAGTYTVTQPTQPAGTTNGQTVPGSTGGTGTVIGVTPSAISSINLTGVNTISAVNNFAEIATAAPDLVVSKTHTPSIFSAGSTAGFFTITPRNIGPLATTGNVQVADTLPAGLTPTAATGTGWVCGIAAQVVTCNSVGVIAANANGNTIQVNVTVGAGQEGNVLVNNVAISGGGEPVSFAGNNTNTDAVSVRETFTPVVGIAKAKPSAEVVNANGTVTATFRLHVQNYGLEPLVNVSVDDVVTGAAPAFGTFKAGGAGAALANGEYTVQTAPSTACATGIATASFAGVAAAKQVGLITSLALNAACDFDFAIRFKPSSPLPVGGYSNTATTTATGQVSGATVTDNSVNGANADPNGDNNPSESSPTPVTFAFSGSIGIAKALQSGLLVNSNGSYTGSFRLKVQNYGNEGLDNVSVNDLMSGAAPAFGTFVAGGNAAVLTAGQYTIQTAPSFNGACTGGSLTAGFTATGVGTQLAAITQLAIGASCSLDFTYRFVPIPGQAYTNQATTSGKGTFSGTVVNDNSQDGTDPDPDADSNPTNNNTPTPVPIPRIGIAKSAGAVVNNGDGTYTVPFTLTVVNAGGTALNTVQVVDDLTGTNASGKFGTYTLGAPVAGQYTISIDPAITGVTNAAALTAVGAATYTGSAAGISLLVPATSGLPNFGAGTASRAQITFSVKFFPITTGPFNNTAVATGSSPAGGNVTDNSVNGGTPDADGNGDPGNDTSPTPVVLSGQVIGAAKSVSGIIQLGNKRYSIPYTLIVANPSATVTATNVQLVDSLTATFPTASSITIGSAPVVSACTGTVLNANAAYTGIGANNLLVGNQNLQPTEQCTIKFTTIVDFGANPLPSLVQNNSATATTAQTPGGAVIATDLSANGNLVDPNGNGITNEAGENDPTPVSFAPGSLSAVTGKVYLDANHDRLDNDPLATQSVKGFIVEVVNSAGTVVGTTTTDANGNYTIGGLFPSTAGNPATNYKVRFREPTSGAIYGQPQSTDDLGHPNGTINNGLINALQLLPGTTTVKQNLPLDPSGVIYNSITRQPVLGASVTLLFGGVPVLNTCLVGGVNTQVTGAAGFYQFLLINPTPVGCPGAGVYTISVVQPAGYVPPASTIIPPTAGPHVPPAGGVDPIQAQAGAPTGTQPTTYFYSFNLTPGISANVVNNHIPLDQVLAGAIIAQKITPLVNVSRGDLVPYTLTFTNTLEANIPGTNLVDTIPPGFKYKVGTTTVDGVAFEPTVNGRNLTWLNITFTPKQKIVVKMLLVVGSGVQDGEYVNSTLAINALLNTAISNTATATVRVVPDPTFDCSDLIGKVFDDKNANGYQDEGEPGIPNVRLATVNGLLVTTDAEGRFHVTCADVPLEFRGSNFLMKLDERTLPTGYRVTTENPRDVRLTRGKLSKLNFGAAIHRVVRIELSADAFKPNSVEPLADLAKSMADLPAILREKASVVRFAYALNGEDEQLVRNRMKALRNALEKTWKDMSCCYALTFEEEIFMPLADAKGGAK